jgi:Zn finger protein HypA/HybF involved in hydrogenase expression
MPDFFKVAQCPGCKQYYPEAMLNVGLCDGCDMDNLDFDDDDYRPIDPNTCSSCGADTVENQNGDWVCPDCDLWL